jgi:toxin YoeB
MYKIEFTKQATEDLTRLKRNEPIAYRKVGKLLFELFEHPYSGTGKPKPLGYGRTGQWSRRITSKHRLVYSVDDEKITVLVITASGHYDD